MLSRILIHSLRFQPESNIPFSLPHLVLRLLAIALALNCDSFSLSQPTSCVITWNPADTTWVPYEIDLVSLSITPMTILSVRALAVATLHQLSCFVGYNISNMCMSGRCLLTCWLLSTIVAVLLFEDLLAHCEVQYVDLWLCLCVCLRCLFTFCDFDCDDSILFRQIALSGSSKRSVELKTEACTRPSRRFK